MRLLKTLVRPLALAGLLLLLPFTAFAQDGAAVPVPDLIGASLPEAAARLNAAGLALGPQTDQPWAESAGLPGNTVSAQAVPPGQSIAAGSAVGVTVLRSPNVLLLYDRDGITLINQTGASLDLNGLIFSALDGAAAASFPATNWLGSLPAGDCAQLWAVRRTGPSRPAECEALQRWLSTVNPGAHFWTDANSVTRFSVAYGGIERATCDGAVAGAGQQRCAFYLPAGGAAGDVTEYIYLAYTTDRLIVFNQSADRWMPLGETQIYNYNPNIAIPGSSLVVGDASLYAVVNPVAEISRLAPGQCLFMTNSNPEAVTPPQPCEVIARLDIGPDLIFWAADFEVGSASDGQQRTCPAASAGKLTLCVMPR